MSNFITYKQTCKGEVQDQGPRKIVVTNFMSNTGTGPCNIT